MYRTEHHKPRRPVGRAVDRSTDTIIEVANGIRSRIAFPCYYAYRPDGMPFPFHELPPIWRDHLGWPRPDQRDHSFQPHRIEGLIVEPIHLSEEGYESAIVTTSSAPGGLEIEGYIDDYIVRIDIDAMCPMADDDKVDTRFAIYLEGTFDVDGRQHAARDLVTSGIIRIIPAIHDNILTGEQPPLHIG